MPENLQRLLAGLVTNQDPYDLIWVDEGVVVWSVGRHNGNWVLGKVVCGSSAERFVAGLLGLLSTAQDTRFPFRRRRAG
jgi:hypothetical protein